VADLRGTPLHWATATAAPCTSVFKPVRVSEPVPPEGATPTNHFDPEVGWWRHERLHRLALRDLPGSIARFTAARDRTEAAWLADPPSTASAFEVADELEAGWLADLLGADLPDRRAWWLRRAWRRLDDAAAMAEPAHA
jgi:hypothetical protein